MVMHDARRIAALRKGPFACSVWIKESQPRRAWYCVGRTAHMDSCPHGWFMSCNISEPVSWTGTIVHQCALSYFVIAALVTWPFRHRRPRSVSGMPTDAHDGIQWGSVWTTCTIEERGGGLFRWRYQFGAPWYHGSISVVGTRR